MTISKDKFFDFAMTTIDMMTNNTRDYVNNIVLGINNDFLLSDIDQYFVYITIQRIINLGVIRPVFQLKQFNF